MLEQKQLEDLAQRVTAAVGLSKLQALSKTQAQMCEVMLAKRLEKVDFQIDQFKAADMIRHPLRALFVVSVFVYDETVLEGQYIDAQVLFSFAISVVGGAAILAIRFCRGQSAIERFPMYVLNFLKEASENSTNHIRTFKTYPMRVWANCVVKGCIRRKVLHDGVDIVRVKGVTYGIY